MREWSKLCFMEVRLGEAIFQQSHRMQQQLERWHVDEYLNVHIEEKKRTGEHESKLYKATFKAVHHEEQPH